MFSRALRLGVQQSRARLSPLVASSSPSLTSLAFTRFNSSAAGDSKDKKESLLLDHIKNFEFDDNGDLIQNQKVYGYKDFEESNYAKHLANIKKEQEQLIDEKLRALSELNGVPYETLKAKFDEKIISKLSIYNQQIESVDKTLAQFDQQLSTPSIEQPTQEYLEPESESIDLAEAIVQSIANDPNGVKDSQVYQVVSEIDPKLAELVKTAVEQGPNESNIQTIYQHAQTGPLSQISPEQQFSLASLLETSFQEQTESKNAEGYLHLIFDHFNNYDKIETTKLYEFFQTVDSEFAKLLIEYQSTDSENDELLGKQYEKLLEYISNKESAIFTLFSDEKSEKFAELKAILDAPQPIELTELYEVFDGHADYFTSKLFLTLKEIDSKFAQLLIDLENVPEGEQLDAKNEEVDTYLSDANSPINKALSDVESNDYAKLRTVLDAEQEALGQFIPFNDVLEYLNEFGAESDGIQLIKKIDAEFGQLLTEFSTAEIDQQNSLIDRMDEMISSEGTAIHDAMNNTESLNYKLLLQTLYPDSVEDSQEQRPPTTSATTTINNTQLSVQPTESRVTSSKDDQSKLEALAEEDQSAYSIELQLMNKAYDQMLSAIEELEIDYQNESVDEPSRDELKKISKSLEFQPSQEQINEAQSLKQQFIPDTKDEVLDLCVNLIMKDGLKQKAKKYLNRALFLVFLETRKSPVELLKEALDIAAPLVITKTVKTGFAKSFIVPYPLTPRQRNRMAFKWILDASDSRASNDFPVRLAEEIINVVQGKSKILDKRSYNHKVAIANRAYLKI